jgi:urea transport system permease protein
MSGPADPVLQAGPAVPASPFLSPITLPTTSLLPRRSLLGARSWLAVVAAAVVLVVGVPVGHLAFPEGHALHLSSHYVVLLGKILCYAICALAMDLIWGYAGILSLGHGLFFALGGYAMGMYLMRQIGSDGQYRLPMPDFMVFLNWKEFPWHWALSDSFVAQALLVVAAPGLLAFVFGYFAFRSRIKGVYFSIITQALTYAAMLLFFRNETGFGGNNGFTDFKRILGVPLNTPQMRVGLCVLSGLVLIGFFLLGRVIVQSRFGRVLQAIRDAESRVMFTGYDPVAFKLAIWTLSAVMCGIAGALYVPQVGIINPSEMSPAASIEIAIWAAVGGRGTLVGPIVGAFFVNGAKSWFTVVAPQVWLFFLGALFIAVTLFLPRGLMGLLSLWAMWRERRAARVAPRLPDLPEAAAPAAAALATPSAMPAALAKTPGTA